MFFSGKNSSFIKQKIIKIIFSLQAVFSVDFPTETENRQDRTFLHTSLHCLQQGGMVLEATLVLPLFLMAVLTMVGFLNFYYLQTKKLVETCEMAKNTGMYAMLSNMENDITIPKVYQYKTLFSAIPLPTIYMINTVTVRPWIGENITDRESAETESMVYITEGGTVYHKKDCSYLQPSVQSISYQQIENLRTTNGDKYRKCQQCGYMPVFSDTVYITSTGNCYHTTKSCSSLKHVSIMVKLSEVENRMRPCSRCGG